MLSPLLLQEEGGAKPTVVVAELGDPKRDPGYWVSYGSGQFGMLGDREWSKHHGSKPYGPS